MKKQIINEEVAVTENEVAALSRRTWLQRVSLPAMAVVGAGMLTTNAKAAPQTPAKTDVKMLGASTYNIRDYGAKGDGKTLDTAAIQAAIDACTKDKGGIVLVPAGDFICGTVELKSNVTLQLAAQGNLLGSPRRKDYTAGKGVPPGNGNIVFLYAVNAQNVTIEGPGTIDGNGKAFYTGQGDNTGPGQKGVGGNFDRPHLLIFYQCTKLVLHNAFFTASAYHCCRLLKCTHVYIDAIRIYNRVNKNNDGFHFNDGQYVHITNCDVQCQDDACALFGSNKFVTITNCSFSTRWSIFRFGGGESQNIAITNCLIYDTYGCPVKISAGRAGISDLTFSNIIMRNVTGPIGIGFSGPVNDHNTSANQPAGKPYIRNIAFNGIRATVVRQPVNHPDIAWDVNGREGEKNSCITLNAMGEYYLENISFTDVHVTFAGGGTADQAAKKDIPQIAAEYFGVWDPKPGGPPAYGMYARNVKGLTMNNVRLEYEEADMRPAVIFDNVQDALVTGLSAKGNTNNQPVVRVINSKDILLSACRVLTAATAFLSIEGHGNEGITLDGGDLRKVSTPVTFQDGGKEQAVKLRV